MFPCSGDFADSLIRSDLLLSINPGNPNHIVSVDGRGVLIHTVDSGTSWSPILEAGMCHLPVSYLLPGSSLETRVCVEVDVPRSGDGPSIICSGNDLGTWAKIKLPPTGNPHRALVSGHSVVLHSNSRLIYAIFEYTAKEKYGVPGAIDPAYRNKVAYTGDEGMSWTSTGHYGTCSLIESLTLGHIADSAGRGDELTGVTTYGDCWNDDQDEGLIRCSAFSEAHKLVFELDATKMDLTYTWRLIYGPNKGESIAFEPPENSYALGFLSADKPFPVLQVSLGSGRRCISRNGGQTWSALPLPPGVAACRILRRGSGAIFCLTENQIHRTFDWFNWQNISPQMGL